MSVENPPIQIPEIKAAELTKQKNVVPVFNLFSETGWLSLPPTDPWEDRRVVGNFCDAIGIPGFRNHRRTNPPAAALSEST